MPTIESLELKVSTNAQSATASIEKLKGSLAKLGDACSKAVSGMSGTADKINQLGNATRNLAGAEKLTAMAEGLRSLSKVGKLKIDGSLATTITTISDATSRIDVAAVHMLHPLADGLVALKNVGTVRIPTDLPQTIEALSQATNKISFSTAGSLMTLARGLEGLRGISTVKLNKDLPNTIMDLSDALALFDTAGLSKISELVTALNQLGEIGKNNLKSVADQLMRLPEVANALAGVDLTKFTNDIRQITEALAPLATQLQSVGAQFQKLPASIDKVSVSTTRMTASTGRLGSGLRRIITTFIGIYSLTDLLSKSIASSMEYIESYNLFNVALGDYAEAAEEYANKVSNALGIDPAAWMREQGVFQTLIEGFGVAGDKAIIMSQNLTQLGYDLASFFNMDVATALQKVESGIAGELEPMRRLGYDLSETRLKAIALELGITKSYKAMTQAEKSQLRYYAMLTQVTTAQGDMARTISQPANQMRVLQAQITQLCRALGDLFIPILTQVLPYIIAFTKAIKNLITAINALFSGSKDGAKSLGIMSTGMSSFASVTSSASSAASELAKNAMGYDEMNMIIDEAASGTSAFASETAQAASEVEKLAKNAMGYDELNMITDVGKTGGGGGGKNPGDDDDDEFDIEPPSYDFLGDAINEQVDKIYSKLEPIITWITDHMELIKGAVEAIGILIAAWKMDKFMTGLGDAKTLLGKIGSLLAAAAVAVITVTFSYKFTKNYLKEGNAVDLILSGLTSILGSVLTGKLVARALGASSGYIAGAITLALAAGADIYAKYNGIKENGFNGSTILVDVLAALKGALAGVALAKALKLSTSGLFSGGLIGMGITFMISGLAGLAAVNMKDDNSVTAVWVNSLWTTVGGAITGVGIAKALGLSVVSSGVIGGVIGIILAAAVTLAKVSVAATEFDATPGWGDIVLTSEQVKQAAQALFNVDIEAHISYTKTVTENLSNAVNDVNNTIEDINTQLNKLNIGGEIDPDTWSAVKAALFDGEDALIPKLQSQLLEEANQLQISLEILTPLDSEGNILTSLIPDADLLNSELSSIGKTMSTYISKGITTGLTSQEEYILGVTKDFFINLNAKLKDQEIELEFGTKMDDLLKGLSKDSMADVVATFKSYKDDLKDEYTDLANEQYKTLKQQQLIYQELYDYYVALGDEEKAAEIKTTLDGINTAIDEWDLDTTVSEAIDRITGPGEETLANSLITIFQEGFADAKFDDVAAEYQHYWENSLGDEISNMSTEQLSEKWGGMIEKMVSDSMDDADLEVFREAKDTFGITEWDVLSDSTKKELVASMVAAVGADETKRVLTNLGYDVTDLISDGATSTKATAAMEQAGKDAVKAVNNGVEKTDVTDITVDVDVDLEKGDNWLGKTVTGWVNGFLGDDDVKKKVDLTKSDGWKNTTVGGWITNSKSNFGDDVAKKVNLVKNGWTTVFGFTTNKDNFGGNVDKKVDLEKGNWSGKNVKTWITNIDDNFGGTVEKAVSLAKKGWTTVGGYVNGSPGGDVTKPVGLKKNWIGDTIQGWITNTRNKLFGGDVTKPVVPTASFTDILSWMISNKLIGGAVEKVVSLVRGTSWKDGIDQWIVGKNGKWSHDYTINLKKKPGNKLTWNPSINGTELTLAAAGGIMSQGQMFIAREAGPELVGSIGSRTAVANNDQIVEAVSLGVYQAVSAAMSNNNAGENANITINLDGRVIYENQQKIARGRGVDLGMGAFAYGG